MDRQALRKAMSNYGNFMNVTQVAECLGITRDTARQRYLRGVDYLPNGNEKLYLKEDILDSILENRKCD